MHLWSFDMFLFCTLHNLMLFKSKCKFKESKAIKKDFANRSQSKGYVDTIPRTENKSQHMESRCLNIDTKQQASKTESTCMNYH